jgi:hypothetical protein
VHELLFFKLFLTNFIISSSPRTPEELFNLRHASACNTVEWIFGILKRCFRILYSPPEYDMSIQALIPSVLTALHNFIRHYDPEEVEVYDDPTAEFNLKVLEMAAPAYVGNLGAGPASAGERMGANARQDTIARDMWAQYLQYLESRGAVI